LLLRFRKVADQWIAVQLDLAGTDRYEDDAGQGKRAKDVRGG
jgi:hypothetical protein